MRRYRDLQLRHAGLALVFCAAASYLVVEIKRNLIRVRYSMAYITQAHSNIFPAIWEKITGFFVTVGRSLVLSAAMDSRLKRVEALNLKTDEELAKMNLRRENITAYVFRDLMHI